MNITEKILAQASHKKEVSPDDIIQADIDIAMSHDGTSPPTIKSFEKFADKVWDPEKIVIVFDHNYPANTIGSAEFQKVTTDFIKKQGITNKYIHGEGICHQILPEKGYIKPSNVIVGADSHTCTYGAFGAFSTGLGATDLAMVYATGQTWFKVPEAFKINIEGTFKENVYSKDLILNIIKTIGSYGATYKTLEFTGSTINNLSMAARMTMTNMAIEAGAKNGIIEPDKKTEQYLKDKNITQYQITRSDKDAQYEKIYDINVNEMPPQVACPHNVDNVKPVDNVEGTHIDQAVIGSCTNGRYEDLKQAAKVIENHQVHEDTKLLVFPASQKIYQKAIKTGIINTFINANATICNPGCGPCLGAHMGVLTKGQKAISTTNRNFLGRMGDPKSEVYLANPAVVTASAIKGEITDPQNI